MAVVALQTSATNEKSIRLLTRPSHGDQRTAPAAEAITAGAPVRVDATTGRWTNANGTAAGEAATHIAWKTAAAGENVTGVRNCIVDGYVLDALAYGAVVYVSDTDGRLDTVAGTVSAIAGRVVPVYATLLGVAADKALDVGSFGH
jgi:hypothetical protein